jgi:hydroxypyruvate isomerase
VQIVKAVGRRAWRLLYDIYHMQIMEGDVIRTIQQQHDYIGHFHTGRCPDDAGWITGVELGGNLCGDWQDRFRGYVAHEFLPTVIL